MNSLTDKEVSPHETSHPSCAALRRGTPAHRLCAACGIVGSGICFIGNGVFGGGDLLRTGTRFQTRFAIICCTSSGIFERARYGSIL